MFVIDNILISDDLVDAPFTCDLGACHGACCVKGDSGAPLEEDEIAEIEAVVSIVENRLRPEAREVIRHDGVWTESSPGQFAVACVGASECVFVYYEGPIAKCAIENAFEEGKTKFRKPISCHLYPIRIEQLGDFEGLNYERPVEVTTTTIIAIIDGQAASQCPLLGFGQCPGLRLIK